MQSFQNFFTTHQPPSSTQKSPEAVITIVDSKNGKAIEGNVFFSDINTFFQVSGKTYQLNVKVQMQPIWSNLGQSQNKLDTINLKIEDEMLQLHSSKLHFLVEVYQQLKKTISHAGFNDYFKPLKRLGRGSFATVYLLESKITGQKMAAKVFTRQGHQLSFKGKESLEKEIDYLKRLDHPNIIKFDGIYQTDNLIYVVTEYLSGGNLTQFRRQNSLNIGQFVPKILNDILAGLQYLKKKKIMHRDIKPENIVLRKEDNTWVLVDFGIASNCEQPLLYSVCGTRGYMAPQVNQQNKKPYTESCDMYSFGVICYELILGYLPFKLEMENMYDMKFTWVGLTKKDCSQLNPQIVKLLNGLLEVDPELRWTPDQVKKCGLMERDKNILDEWYKERENKKAQKYNKILQNKEVN